MIQYVQLSQRFCFMQTSFQVQWKVRDRKSRHPKIRDWRGASLTCHLRPWKNLNRLLGAWEGISLEGKIVYGRIKSYRTNIRSCPSIPEAVFMIVLHPPCCKLLLLQQCSEGWGSCQGNSDWLPMCSTVLTALYYMNLNLYWYLMSTWDINAQPLAALRSWQLQAATRSQVKEQAAAACEVETEMVPLLLTPRGSRTLSWEIRLEKITAWSLVWLWNAVNLKRCNGLSLLCIQDSLMEIWWSWRAWEWGCTTSTRTTLISFLCAREHDQNFVAWETAFSNTTRLRVLQ